MCLLWCPTPLGRHGISLLGLVALAMDTSQSLLEQIGHSTLPDDLSSLLLGYSHNPDRTLHEVHWCFVPSRERLSTQQQAHLYDLFRMDDRLCQFGIRLADGDQLLLSLHLFVELVEVQFIVTIACHGHFQ